MVENRALFVGLCKLIVYILKLNAFTVFLTADMTNAVVVHLLIRDCLLCRLGLAVALCAFDRGGNLILFGAGELTAYARCACRLRSWFYCLYL